MRMLATVLIALAILSGLGTLLSGPWRRTRIVLACCAALLAAAATHAAQKPLHDGGTSLLYEIDLDHAPGGPRSLSPATAGAQTMATVGRRLDAFDARGVLLGSNGRMLEVAFGGDAELAAQVKDSLQVVGRIEFLLVDDEHDFFEQYVDTRDGPADLKFERENAPLGPGKTKPVWYAFQPSAKGEPMAETRRRLLQWTATLPVPEDHRIAVERVVRFDTGTRTWEDEGWRTFYLFRHPEVETRHIRQAEAWPGFSDRTTDDWSVRLDFTPEGAQRFEDVTGRTIKRRFAIVLDGIVESAPVVQSKIGGGTGVITMGAGSPEEQGDNARRLAVILQTGELPAPLLLLAESARPALISATARKGLTYAAAALLAAQVAWLLFRRRGGRA